MIPGEVISAGEDIICNQGRDAVVLSVENTSRYPVYVTSHYHFFEVNRRLSFDRRAAYGKRLDVPSGSGVRWGAGAGCGSPAHRHRGQAEGVRVPGLRERRPVGNAGSETRWPAPALRVFSTQVSNRAIRNR